MFSYLILLIALIPQGGIASVAVQGSVAQVQSNVREAEVQTQNLQVTQSQGLPAGLNVAPVNPVTLTSTVAH